MSYQRNQYTKSVPRVSQFFRDLKCCFYFLFRFCWLTGWLVGCYTIIIQRTVENVSSSNQDKNEHKKNYEEDGFRKIG